MSHSEQISLFHTFLNRIDNTCIYAHFLSFTSICFHLFLFSQSSIIFITTRMTADQGTPASVLTFVTVARFAACHLLTNKSPSDFSPAGFAHVGGIENFRWREANGVHLALTGWYFHSHLALTNCIIWSHLFTVPFLRELFCLCRAVRGGKKRAGVGYD